ncbi:hypothetical protein LOZ53_006119 [Ophidiomyces ophidiicola]|uniref:Uncharacterized protein n=1 Tax=Ophidiomyces ophidiicola TaxID=1387563 RepID=A0ACB8UTH9_9EURO|nr:uncharacterized protein LOZ57_001372 [Ophidiomyces ophidiicola]KAI1908390.1 hypothetical protein LOZ64_005570 [Ophidiomyces ophidiicola]KAI1908749.1 hypothetical protein LOZ61_005379 [Ophidiomyces ophidiicola]KAI1920845.1 hypothetical protein LOZ60_006477 [Ophidiomyces ophidiicola]KAI1933948.1 hypothetical protein LOZ62_006373 [Ophidiomyces ophidiicola]KAI1951958.1 hypothetical protein LOZ57_001372 [Ophidiomyces ophidiicola]
MASIEPLPKWAIDMNTPPPRPSKANIPDPPGYSPPSKASTKQVSTKASMLKIKSNPYPYQKQKPSQLAASAAASARKSSETDALKLKKAWEIAFAPAKQIPMNAIMMYMSGNSLQIFSIMMVFMLFKGPIQGLVATNSTFVKFETEGIKTQLIGVKIVYILMQFLLLALGVWKVNGMGLLPTTRSDWLAWEVERVPLERAYFAFR